MKIFIKSSFSFALVSLKFDGRKSAKEFTLADSINPNGINSCSFTVGAAVEVITEA